MGITDQKSEGNWLTFKGTAITYTKWDDGEPNNSYGQDYAAYWLPGGIGGWQTKIDKAWDDVKEDQYCAVYCDVPSCSGGERVKFFRILNEIKLLQPAQRRQLHLEQPQLPIRLLQFLQLLNLKLQKLAKTVKNRLQKLSKLLTRLPH